ncbi:hypothetical protein SeMB42_g00793 [Synchytrium endobioticum]|uniref:DNA replication complex GINS protein SLD5 n=1 Tax=Synchytrium endobioticum TaxID=286115 RepID=A0A507DIZ1_9FUNG|nr:hypothetical protein SeLEV6574_g00285 [Synchytrium endobioticum]TPX53406.1 hypothetical protein SeMB42_g00793 [Synchytrium endobioticum]
MLSEGNDVDHEQTYANDDVKALTHAWVNERCSPELLPYESTLMANLLEMLDAQSNNIDSLRDGKPDNAFLQVLYQQEMERIKFVMRSYLRARLAKIEEHSMHCLREQDYRRRMSPQELAFAERYDEMLQKHYIKSSLDELHPSLQRLDEATEQSNMVQIPDLDNAVFCRVVQDVGDFQIGDRGTTVTMERGNVYIVKYRAIRTLLADKKVELL